jgi:methylglutaconyl-CoA hydratase
MGARAAHRYFLTAERFDCRRGACASASCTRSWQADANSMPGWPPFAQALVAGARPAAVQAPASKLLARRRRPRDRAPALVRQAPWQRIADIRTSDEGREGVRAFLGKSASPHWLLGS